MSTHKIPFLNIKKKIILNHSKSAAMGFIPRGPNNELETALVNEPSVFEPLKLYCSLYIFFVIALFYFNVCSLSSLACFARQQSLVRNHNRHFTWMCL